MAYCGSAPYQQKGTSFKVVGNGVTMECLLLRLSDFFNRPLVDRTGYTKTFNATVSWYRDPMLSLSSTDRPSLLAAQPSGPDLLLVIDHVERPSGN
jgi:uncharacterized protein (TIGR03435 family)